MARRQTTFGSSEAAILGLVAAVRSGHDQGVSWTQAACVDGLELLGVETIDGHDATIEVRLARGTVELDLRVESPPEGSGPTEHPDHVEVDRRGCDAASLDRVLAAAT